MLCSKQRCPPDSKTADETGRACESVRRPGQDPARLGAPARRRRQDPGTAPIDASSGDHVRHRLSRGGNRQINRVLHIMATVQLRNPTEGRAYHDRKKAAGKTSMEAMRCLKRRLSDLVYRQMVNDFIATAKTGPGGHPGNDSASSATGSHPTPALRINDFGMEMSTQQLTAAQVRWEQVLDDRRPGRQRHCRFVK